ncbi:MAG TPA: ABC transporter substrate-binding protein [Actinomycetota bacterium]
MPGSGPRPAPRRILSLALTALAVACTQPPPEARESPIPGPTLSPQPTLRVGVGPIATLDPARVETPDEILAAAQIFDGLVEVDASGEIVPAAAASWEIEEGGARFVFRLEGSTFHDGSPVRAQDFVFAWERLVDPVERYPFAFLLEEVEGFGEHRASFGARPLTGIEARDAATLAVTLSEPNMGFLALLSHPALSPIREGSSAPSLAALPIGNGPYALAEDLGLDGPIVLEAAGGVEVGVARVELRPSEEVEEAWPEFLARRLDVARIPAAFVGDEDEEGVRATGRLLYCGFNLRSRRFSRAVRVAVSIAIDREALARGVYGGLATRADGLVPPTFPGYRAGACDERCELDRLRAEELIAELPRRERAFRLDFPTSEVGIGVAQGVQRQLAQIGLNVNLRGHDEDQYARLLQEGEQEAFCLVWVADAPTAQAVLDPLLDPDSPDNRTGIEDEDLARLLERARTAASTEEREELYARAERRALELMPLVPLAWFRSNVAAQEYVTGLEVDPLGRFDMAALAFDEG